MGISIQDLDSYEAFLSSRESSGEVKDLSKEELKLTGGSGHPGRGNGYGRGGGGGGGRGRGRGRGDGDDDNIFFSRGPGNSRELFYTF